MTVKPVPKCPHCKVEMTKVGTRNRGELNPKRVFMCMNQACLNKRTYFRDGTLAT